MRVCVQAHACVCVPVPVYLCVCVCACVLVCMRDHTSERGLCIYKHIHEGGSGANCSILIISFKKKTKATMSTETLSLLVCLCANMISSILMYICIHRSFMYLLYHNTFY